MAIDPPRAHWRSRTAASSYATFVFAFLAFLVYAYVHRNLPFRGDAWEIWEVSKHFYEPDRAHSFVEYRGPLAFVLYNAVYRVASALSLEEVTGFRLFAAALFALLTTCVVPALASRLLERRSRLAEVLLFVLATLYFFGGYLLYPQVDVLALTLFLGAVVLCLAPPSKLRPYIHAAAGLLLLGAVALRMNYLVALPVLLMVGYARLESGPGPKRRAVIFVAVGMLAIVAAVALLGQRADSSQSRVLRKQLGLGLSIEKIEWNAGDSRFPGSITVADPAGAALLASHASQPGKTDRLTLLEYLNLAIRHPLTMGRVWVKHLFNGLDLWYDTVYVQDLHRGRLLRSLLNYTLFFLAFLAIRARLAVAGITNRKTQMWTLAAIALPALSAIPFVVEVRFFIPIIVSAHAIAIFGWRDALPQLQRVGPAVGLLLFVGACLALSLSVSARAGLHFFGVA